MNPIHPSLAPGVQPNAAARPADAARSAAQKAFFEIALGKAPAAAATAAAAPVQASAPAATASVQRAPQAPSRGEAPARTLRPGSLLDIRV